MKNKKEGRVKNNTIRSIVNVSLLLMLGLFSSSVISQENNQQGSILSIPSHKIDRTNAEKVSATPAPVASVSAPITTATTVPTPTLTPTLTPTAPALPNYGKNLAEMFLYLGVVVGLIFLLAWLVKKLGNNHFSSTQLMQVTACLPLSTKEKLMVVQIGEEQIVIGVAPGFVGHITSLKTPLEANKPLHNSVDKTPFSHLLARFQRGGRAE